MANVQFRALGTNIQFCVHPTDVASISLPETVQLAETRIRELEALLSRFRPDSELSQLNRNPGRWLDVHPDTLEILLLAQQAFARTSGFFNPCLGAVLEHIGYSVSFEQLTHLATNNVLVYELPVLAPRHCPFVIDERTTRVCLEPGNKFDLGGIAKGWIVSQAAKILRQAGYTQFLCNAGGDMVCAGMDKDHPWCVAIANPHDLNQGLLNLDLVETAIATSGSYRRNWVHDGKQVHHIIDPFFGRPTTSDVISCSVIHTDIVQAEVLAKVGLLLGAAEGQSWLHKQHVPGWLIVKDSGEVIHSWS